MKRALLIAAIVALRSAFGAGGVGDRVVELADEITSKVSASLETLQNLVDSMKEAKKAVDDAAAAMYYNPSQSMNDYTQPCEVAVNTAALRVKFASEEAAKKAAVWQDATKSIKDETEKLQDKYAKALAQKGQEILDAMRERQGVSPNTADFATKAWCMTHLCPTAIVEVVGFDVQCDCVRYQIDTIGETYEEQMLPDGSVVGTFPGLRDKFLECLYTIKGDSWVVPESVRWPLEPEEIP